MFVAVLLVVFGGLVGQPQAAPLPPFSPLLPPLPPLPNRHSPKSFFLRVFVSSCAPSSAQGRTGAAQAQHQTTNAETHFTGE